MKYYKRKEEENATIEEKYCIKSLSNKVCYQQLFYDNYYVAFRERGHYHNKFGQATVFYDITESKLFSKNYYINGKILSNNFTSNKEFRKYIKLLAFQ